MKTELKYVRDLKEGEKLSPQARVILTTLKATGGKEFVERNKLVEVLEKQEAGSDDSLKLKTRQGASRVLGFYIPRMRDLGVIEVKQTKETPDKPATEKKTEAKKPEPAKA